MKSEENLCMHISSHLKKLRPALLYISREGTSRLSSVLYISHFLPFFPNISKGGATLN